MTFKSFDRDVYKSRTWQYTSKEEQFGPDEELSGVKINDKKYYFQSDGQKKNISHDFVRNNRRTDTK